MHESVFRDYYSRLRREGLIKALLWGLAIGFFAAFIAAFATWMSYFKGFYLTVGILVGVTALCTVALYFLFFKPTAKDVARRVDKLGLEERLITMLELEKCEDYIALRQREDAKESLSRLGMTKFKFGVSLTLILLLAIGGILGLGMTTVTALSDFGVLPSGAQLIDEARGRNPANYIEICYEARSGGIIYGETEQLILKKETTSTVIAVADDGYRFYRWTDGYPYPARSDTGTEDITYTAWFLPMDADGAEEKPEGDAATDQPREDGNDQDEQEPSGGGGTPPNYDYLYDWTIHYREVFGDYYDEIIEELSQGGEISEELRRFIETYCNSIK